MLIRVVTNSERSTSACERRWAYRYVEGIAPSGESPAPLRQGTLVHRLLDAWYRQGCPPPPEAASLARTVVEPWLDQRREIVLEDAAYHGYDPEPTLAENAEIAAEAWGMVCHYVATYGDHDRTEWEIVGVGVQCARWLPHPEHGGPLLDRPPATLKAQSTIPGTREGAKTWRRWVQAGEADLIIRERSTGLTWLVEHKTTSEHDLIRYARKLSLDPQIRGYAWLFSDPVPALSDVRSPIRVAGVIHNVLRKSVPREPHLLAAPKPTKKNPSPRSPGLSRDKRIDTTREMYLGAILRHGFDPDDYLDILDELSRRRFFSRERYPLTTSDHEDWVKDAAWWALTRIEAQRRPHHPRQVSVCTGPAAAPCPYARICLEDGEDVRVGYQLRTVRHEELRGDLADPLPITQERQLATRLVTITPRARTQQLSEPEPDPFA